MAKPLTPLEQKQLSAFLEIIPNTDIHLVQEALDTGFYRGVSLNEAKEFLLEHEDFKSLKDSLTGSTAYSRPEFEEFLKKIKTHPNGLYDRLKKALWNNDRDILDPSSSPKDSVNTASGELTPPHALEKEDVTPVTPPTFSPIAASTSGGELKSAIEKGEEQENEEVNEAPQALSDQGHEKLNRINRSMQQTKTGLSQSTPTTGEPLQRMSTRLNSSNRSLQRSTPTTLGRAKARRSALISSQTRRKVAAGAMLGSGGGGAASSGLLGNLLGARSGLQLLKSALSRFGFNGAASWIGKLLPEKLIAQGLRGLWNLGSSFGRAAFDGLIKNAFNLAPRGLSAFGGGGAGSFLTGAGATAAAVVSTAAFWWIAAILVLGTILFWSVYDVNTECGQPGKVELIKTASKEAFEAGEEIQYTISLNYNIKCNSAYLDRVIVRDTLSPDLAYTPNSAKSTKTMEIIDPAQIQDSTSINEPGSVETPPQIDPNFPAADNITLDGNTIVWQLGKVTSNYPVTMTFSATPNQSNIWIPNQATAGYLRVSDAGLFGGGSVPGGGGEAPNQDNCNGKYKLGNPLGNFGDPSCNFTEDALYTQLKQLDPANANYWFDVVIKCESSYSPNAWADPVIVGTPDAEGGWGLVQMGRGKNGQYDHGDVAWQSQTSNAINYNNALARKWRYWACARDRW